jgi:hypothetical protein
MVVLMAFMMRFFNIDVNSGLIASYQYNDAPAESSKSEEKKRAEGLETPPRFSEELVWL